METDPYQDDVRKELCKNWRKLCQSIVSRACLDYVMLLNPEDGCKYLSQWYGTGFWQDHNSSWLESQRMQLEQCFEDGLGELAIAVDKYDLIYKATHRRVSKGHIRKALLEQPHKGRGLQRT